jgi:hypothetical protein
MSRTTGRSAQSKHKIKPISARQRRKAVQKSQLKVRKQTLEVRRPISQRGRTHPMEAPIPGMPTIPQALLLDSTAISRFKYWIDQKRLRIWFVGDKKSVYDYYNVPESVVITLAQAQSKGRYFYYNIRTSYNFRRIR